MLVMTKFNGPDGSQFELHDDTIRDLLALAFITREPTQDLAAEAIEQLRNDLVPTTKSSGRRGRAAAGRQPKEQAAPKEPKAIEPHKEGS